MVRLRVRGQEGRRRRWLGRCLAANCFGWEYKGKGKDLKAAFKQLQLYTPALQYPPLLIVSDIETIVIHTAFPGTVPEIHTLTLDDLLDHANRLKLKWAFTEPERLKPSQGTDALTEAAARRFGELAQSLRGRGHEPKQVAHFLDRLLFCMFAEDVDLLPRNLFTRTLESLRKNPAHADAIFGALFQAMAKGGLFGADYIEHFNGGLFEDDRALPLEPDDLKTLLELARLDWSAIQPSIFGTLFERGLDPDKRSQLGAHYTDPESILRIIRPVILEPLQAEWTEAKALIAKDKTKTRKKAQAAYQGFLERLTNYRVLDPACGSGNFLYLALRTLKDLEHQVILEAETLGLSRGFPQVGPECVMGIELNPYAAELARVTVWIGEIQWMLAHGFNANRNPVLKPLDNIQQRDAILHIPPLPEGEGPGVRAGEGAGVVPIEPEWPEADSIVGNPPFLGDKKMLAELGEAYVTRLRKLYKGRVPGGADLVTYWFEKARGQIEAGKCQRAGLVSTNSIRGGANRKVLERIRDSGRIFNAWSDEPWVNDGAAVRVSLVCFGGEGGANVHPSPRGRGVGDRAQETEIKYQPTPKPLIDFARKLRKEQTDAENLLWALLRDRRFCDQKFRRQHPIKPYVLDFYCHARKLAIELDGSQHGEEVNRRKDAARTAFLEKKGIRVLRFWDNEMLQQTEAVLEVIHDAACGGIEPSPQTPLPRGEGLNAVVEGGGGGRNSGGVSEDGEGGQGKGAASPQSTSQTPNKKPPSPRGRGAGGEGMNEVAMPIRLNGLPVTEIYADLTAPGAAVGSVDLTEAGRLSENRRLSFMGVTKSGPFDIPGELAREWLKLPNPNGKSNSEILFPSRNGQDLAKRPSGEWIINFGTMEEDEACLFEAPFKHALENIKPKRQQSRTAKNREYWWRFERPRPEMFKVFANQGRFIATNLVSKHRFFQWLPRVVVPENVVIVIARSDDTTFGILHSRFHELWSLKMCTWLGKGNDPRYTPTTTFETFPFPEGLTPKLEPEAYANPQAEAIAEAARNLNQLRENWLNPPEWIERVPEVVEGYPDRIIPKPEHEKELKKRTLTNLYNQRPAWLDNAHRKLDEAVAAAYGWEADISDEEVLRRLLVLNLERADK